MSDESKLITPAGSFSFPLLPACHFIDPDFHHAAIHHSFERNIGCFRLKATVEGIERSLTLVDLVKHPRPAVTDHAVAIHMAWVPARVFSHPAKLTANRKTDSGVCLEIIELLPLQPAMENDSPVVVVIVERNDIRVTVQGQA